MTESIEQSNVFKAIKKTIAGDLLDGGCNGGIAGDNLLILNTDPHRKIDVIGISNNKIKDLPIVQAAGLLNTENGPIICIFNEYAGYTQGQTIHSICQLRDKGLLIDEGPRKHLRIDGKPGTQSMIIPHDDTQYQVGLNLHKGLIYFPTMVKPTIDQMEDHSIPKIHMT